MCGIAGALNWRFPSIEAATDCARRMGDALGHRGPDGAGVWRSLDGAVLFSHRRLAIVDLTEAGRQPMTSADGRWTICFNGEIYNHGELRRRLIEGGVKLRGRSDTEALLETIARTGLSDALRASEGMYAFALWDERERTLHLVRDRIGVKPLYWLRSGRSIAFASEIKALRIAPGVDLEISQQGLAEFLQFGFVSAPSTLFANVHKAPPGAILSFAADGEMRAASYWSAWDIAQAPSDDRSDAELVEALAALVRRSVRQEMAADVSVGCFLSGGVDSSLVAAIAQETAPGRLKTFSVGFEDPSIDETAHARLAAEHIGSDHHALHVDAAAAARVLPALPAMFDEPVADMAQIPTFLVSELARDSVAVALSGDGGDELFGGYERYWTALRIWSRLALVPQSVRAALACGLDILPRPAAAVLAGLMQPGIPAPRAAARFRRLVDAMGSASHLGVYRATLALWSEPPTVANAKEGAPPLWSRGAVAADPATSLQLIDLHSYLPDDVLSKVDRASMAVSLEARVPLLNHHIAEFALRLPPRVKHRDGRGKWLLRQVLRRYLPDRLVDRPKQGFSTPLNIWLRGPLREWAGELLSESSLSESGMLRAKPIRRRWREHQQGHADWSASLWAVLSFQAWRRRWHAH